MWLQLALTGLCVAVIPFCIVFLSKEKNKHRKLIAVSVALTFELIMFGAFTRLTDSGLGCPDWPGCYGQANPLLSHVQIKAAEIAMPQGPVTIQKAWIEMVHRYLAMSVGVLICVQVLLAWMRRKSTMISPWLSTSTLVCVCVQGAFGAWTVTLKLQPVIVTTHLLLGMGLLAMLTWLGGRQDNLAHPAIKRPAAAPALASLRVWALATAAVLAVQIALGGWVSTNYATLACNEYPLCGGEWIPPMDFGHGFTLWRELGKTAAGHYLPFAALTAIHWVHRNFAIVLVLVAGWTAVLAWRQPALRQMARLLVAALAVQAGTGLATIYLSFPLAIAVLHNGGAAVLVLLVTMLNYKVKHQLDAARSTPP